VDDCSTDDTRNIERFVRNIKVIRNEKNLGFLFNCNKAAKLSSGKYIVFLNNDTLVQPGWLSWFMKTMEEKPDVGLVGAKLIFSTGELQEAGGVVFKDGSAMNYGRGDDPDQPQYNYFKDVDYCSGACICVRKELWEKLDGFDPQYTPAYYEDTDLAMRIRSLGYRTVYQPKSVVIHFEGISHGTDITQGIKKKQDENQKVFYSKWKEEMNINNFARDENLFKARDKSKNKQTVLLIDYKVPDTTTLRGKEKSCKIIKRYIELGVNIKFMPDNFLKMEPCVSKLEQKGIEILYGTWYKENWLSWVKENANNINTIHFADKNLSDKYLSSLKSIFAEDFNFVIFTKNIENQFNKV
jgi:glycosyltransferase involved in cell wall biosynthesis